MSSGEVLAQKISQISQDIFNTTRRGTPYIVSMSPQVQSMFKRPAFQPENVDKMSDNELLFNLWRDAAVWHHTTVKQGTIRLLEYLKREKPEFIRRYEVFL